jgi:hypothetical protein
MKAFQAYAKGCRTTSAASPRAAAEAFFVAFPDKRKCNVIEGKTDGHFFTVTYGRTSEGEWPQSYKDITKKSAANLPHEVAA